MKALSRGLRMLVVGVAGIGLALATTAVVSTVVRASESEQAKEADKAVSEAQRGFDELDKVDEKLSEGKAKDASQAFYSAVKHFSKALEYLAESELSDQQKQGVELLDGGAKELDKAAKELDKGDIDAAQKHYDSAMDLLEQGMEQLS